MQGLRSRIQATIIDLTSGGGSPKVNFLAPAGDPGLFGPDCVCWKVHADFTSMMVGGVSALLLQALHPLALAGVWDHSNFRQDILGRLRRTASFVSGTTYGSRADAEMLIERVKTIHLRVVGTAEDGRSYAAYQPELLTWVHVAEMYSFLRGYRRYVDPRMSMAEQDRYFAETARVAEKLGAKNVPKSRAAIGEYLEAMRPQLVYSQRSRAVYEILMSVPAPHAAMKPVGMLMTRAGVELLPAWAQQMMGVEQRALLRSAVLRPAIRALAPVMRWALRDGASARARRRVKAPGEPAARR